MQNKFEKYLTRGQELQRIKDLKGAEKQYLRALKLEKRHPEVLHQLGILNVQMRNYPAAIKFFKRAISSEPAALPSLHNLAIIYQGLGRDDEAIAAHEKILSIEPKSAETLGHLARLFEERNRLKKSEEYVNNGLKVNEFSPMLNLIAVRLDRRTKRYEAGLQRIAQMIDPVDRTGPLRKKFLFEYGRLLDLTGNYTGAFEAFNEANKISANTAMANATDGDSYIANIDAIHTSFTSKFTASWKPVSPAYTGDNLVFIVGFPRSGTTLLDNILASHPSVVTLSELPAVRSMINELHRLPRGYPACLAEISENQIATAQKAYFNAIDAIHAPEDTLIVDKLPLNLIYGAALWRVFPDAKYILALRHPCDACLSCLMQDFEPNDAMSNFFTLHDTVTLYRKVMKLWTHYQDILPLQVHQNRYEDVVSEFDTTIKALLAFLGLEWAEEVRKFDKTARDRSHIRTPSYDQVSRPIYTESRYRYTNYADQLSETKALLKPFIEEFGYRD